MDDCFEDFDKEISKSEQFVTLKKKHIYQLEKGTLRSIFYHKGFKGDIIIVKFIQVRNIQDSKQVKQVEIS